MLFSLETASDYVKDEKACFYGFKCVAVGYEFNPGPDEVQMLFSELCHPLVFCVLCLQFYSTLYAICKKVINTFLTDVL